METQPSSDVISSERESETEVIDKILSTERDECDTNEDQNDEGLVNSALPDQEWEKEARDSESDTSDTIETQLEILAQNQKKVSATVTQKDLMNSCRICLSGGDPPASSSSSNT